MLLATVSLLIVALGGAAGQCTGSDNAACASWNRNGFCTNTGYTMEMRKQYCGISCGFCSSNPTQTGGGSPNPPVSSSTTCAEIYEGTKMTNTGITLQTMPLARPLTKVWVKKGRTLSLIVDTRSPPSIIPTDVIGCDNFIPISGISAAMAVAYTCK